MAKSIQEQIGELQSENENLKMLKKLFEKAVKVEFEMDAKDIKKTLKKAQSPAFDFGKKIISFYGLKTREDLLEFEAVFFTKDIQDYFTGRRSLARENEPG